MKDKVNGKLSSKQIKIIYIAITVLVVLAAYFFVFRTNMDAVSKKEDETADLNRQVNSIESLKPELVNLESTVPVAQEEMKKFINKFQPYMTQEHILFNVYDMSVDSEVNIQSVAPGAVTTFFKDSNVAIITDESDSTLSASLSDGSYDQTQKDKLASAAKELEKKDDIRQMVGRTAKYQLNFSGTYDHVMDAFDWISKNSDENMSLGDISLTFDHATGEINCQCSVNFFSMAGNGVTYKAPKTSDFSFGVKKLFGATQK